MKKSISIAALAISAASSSFALIGPPTDVEIKNYCLAMYTDANGEHMAGSCDESDNNDRLNLQLGENGCAAAQISLTTQKQRWERQFPIRIYPCLPPNVVQL